LPKKRDTDAVDYKEEFKKQYWTYNFSTEHNQ
jgi:hypothetical protein